MKAFKRIIVSLSICLAFVFMLASCSKVSKSYADEINQRFQNKNCITLQEAKDYLGEECIDLTTNGMGIIVAIKGLTNQNYLEEIAKAKDDAKFDFIAITVVQNQCQSANYVENATVGEVKAHISRSI